MSDMMVVGNYNNHNLRIFLTFGVVLIKAVFQAPEKMIYEPGADSNMLSS